jgi:hypothetical protein
MFRIEDIRTGGEYEKQLAACLKMYRTVFTYFLLRLLYNIVSCHLFI